MGNTCRNRAIIPLTLLLMIGSLIMVQGPAEYRFDYTGSEFSESEGHLIVLTEVAPTFGIMISPIASRVIITDLTTNGGTIRINAYGLDNETLLSINNISRIIDDGIAVGVPGQEITLNFTREDTDVEVIFTLEEWMYIPPPTVAIAAPIQFFIIGIALFGIGFVFILKIETECREFHGQSRWRRQEGPLAVIVLVVIMASLATPLIYGYAHGDFTERRMSYTSTLDFSYTLTVANPKVTLNILDYLNQGYDTEQIRIGNLESSESIRIRTLADSRILASFPLVNSLESFWIDVKIGEENNHTLELQRIEADTEVSFDLIIIGTYTDSLSNPTIPTYLALVAIVPGICALYQSVIIKRKLEIRDEDRYNSYASPSTQ